MTNRLDRIQGGFWGLLVGDALGVPYEFNGPEVLPPTEEIEFIPPEGFWRTYPSIPPGTWSDDGAQALALLDSLLAKDKMDAEDFAGRLLRWYEEGLWAVDGHVFDVGIQTAESLQAFRSGTPAEKAGWVRPDGKGNGSLMRVLPLALWHRGTDEELVADAHLQSVVTHAHPTNQACCALYCLWARRILEGMKTEEAYGESVNRLRSIYRGHREHLRELEETVRPDEEPVSQGGGYVVETLNSVRLAMREYSYEGVVKAAIRLGEDTDTNAAIAGGLAGIRDGASSIPKRWLGQLRGKEQARQLLNQLLERVD
ncbi:ADP-ribosylglycohydrolase family protein [Kroppenstedtia eburnea]|nr:ADP-ribosylglycohydrolase family protein [Kroppenstedtia eburnea]QKI82301.1 ADP-ribosylglycohydrolase family protein [Kroppenstedtia eburnea]